MKKIMIILTAMFTLAIQANAMSYDQAREYALFLTDKMAYELNLTDDQYEAAYEVNLDYLMSIGSYDDLYGNYWTQRNLDLSYILFDWQYKSYIAASYFYRPLIWSGGYWRFSIYSRYPRRDYLYFGRPHFYTVYRGGHSWRMNNGRSWYHGRTWGGPRPGGGKRIGMRDDFDKGNFRPGRPSSRPNGNRPNNNAGNRKPGNSGSVNRPFSHFGNRTHGNNRVNSQTNSNRNNTPNSNRNNGTFGNRTQSSKNNTPSRNFGSRGSSTRTTVNQNRFTNSNRSFKSNIGTKPRNTFSPRTNTSKSSGGSKSHSSSGTLGGGRK